MEKKLLFRSLATSHITAVIYQPLRREVVAGHEGNYVCIYLHVGGWPANNTSNLHFNIR